MSAVNTFRIQRLCLDVEFNGPEAAGLAFQTGLSDWCSAWLNAALEQVLKDYAPERELHWTLDLLDLQIDDILAPDRLEEQLPGLLQSALNAALKDIMPPGQAPGNTLVTGKNQFTRPEYPGSQMKTATQNTWDAFCHFLRTGWLPWSFHLPGGQSLESAARAVWQESGQRALLVEALRGELRTKEARQRLVRQFSRVWVEEIAATLAPGQTQTIRQIVRLLRRESNTAQALQPAEHRLWEIALAQGAGAGAVYSVAGLMQELLTERLPAESVDLLREIALCLGRSPGENEPDVPAALLRALQFALQDWLESPQPDSRGDSKSLREYPARPEPPDSRGDSKSLREYPARPEPPDSRGDSKSPREYPARPEPSDSRGDSKSPREYPARPEPSDSQGDSKSPPEYPAGGVYIDNAGLVLLHPFIPLFFETLGVAKDEKLTDPGKALALLHFLASGEPTAPEYELVLPKILCGLPPDTVAGPATLLNDNDISESINLLETVIGYWEALKNTSPDGLRDTFLRRPGKISRRDTDWLVQVERQSFDILLDELPWGLSVLQFPWMPDLVWVEW